MKFRWVLKDIHTNRAQLLQADLKTRKDEKLPKTNLKTGKNKKPIKIEFEMELKKEIVKLESKMKIGKSTIRTLAKKLRSRNFPDSEELQKLKFSKNYLKRFTTENKITFTRRQSNQAKVTKEELEELRRPINEILARFPKNRICNLDETGNPFAKSYQRGSYTSEQNMDNFKECCFKLCFILKIKCITLI